LSCAHSSISSAKYVVEPDELAALAFDVPHSADRHRLERPAEAAPALPGVLRDPALLPAIARQKHDNPVRLTELVGA